MKGQKALILVICLLVLTGMTCNAPSFMSNSAAQKTGELGKITFCQEVTDEGQCVKPGSAFSADTTVVYALFTYQNMKDGQKWSRLWVRDGEVYDEVTDEAWDNGPQGWVAYSIEDTNGLSGNYKLSLSLGKDILQTASFSVAAREPEKEQEPAANDAGGFPAFGPITMAKDASDNAFPIGVTRVFEPGTTRVVAVFPYTNMTPNLRYTAEWLQDGKEMVRKEYPWEDTANGMHSTTLYDDSALPAGKYTLNLYLEDELVRTAAFEILGEAVPEAESPGEEATPKPEQRPNRAATPEEVVDEAALKYFYMIYQSSLPVLHQVANDNLTGWTRVKVVNDNPCGEDAVACFSAACDKRWGGTVYMPAAEMSGKEDFEITETLVHELTHGMEHYGGMKCGCTVQKEFYAFAAELDYLAYSGHMDYLGDQYARLWDSNGKVDTGLLWDTIKDGYYSDKCPEY